MIEVTVYVLTYWSDIGDVFIGVYGSVKEANDASKIHGGSIEEREINVYVSQIV